jgi:RsiW-degrading membrane proteinase PrsW (M82 family)
MNEPPEPGKPPPKLYTPRTITLIVGSLLLGSSWLMVREYYYIGSIAPRTIWISVAAFALGLAIAGGMIWHGNKPEK